MGLTDSLCDILKESTETYENLVKLEYDKYDLMIRDDINRLDEIISKEQVFYLKIKGLEQRRQKATRNINMQDKTLKEIIESSSNEEEKYKLKLEYDRLFKVLLDLKKVNSKCKTLIEIRLHRIDNAISKIGEKENTYTNVENQKNKIKNYLISKKI
ncbi:hypothetical protein J2Z76_001625 [Sedimentibacter acidaminivorans]|uniref:FlgN protein n=1 Tax=Sedimentibacter acidaminivorans TaxID=913099 RepID=A0ABS4GDP7_9FIRM|nr:flagellar protein FlgN [Sedimentibacter acidaminivorans]MBP1925764.1 hypothetical protein [Sedimentibacter acidaminivorans]